MSGGEVVEMEKEWVVCLRGEGGGEGVRCQRGKGCR